MYINKLILEHFEFIRLALNSNKLTIDFSNRKNRLCLLVGPNGSGKTSIMSLMTPFATVGNLDVRDGNNLITNGKHGYKEIEIIDDCNVYLIKHFYTPAKGKNHTVKSYIYKNGEDLNPNGNVTSFKEIVSYELRVELDYLKLIRIGSNVSSMISLTETERKNFMSKLLEEMEVFLSFYKKVSNDYKQLSDLIKLTQNKMDKLDISSEESASEMISKLEEKLKRIQMDNDEAIRKQAIADHQMKTIVEPVTLKERLQQQKKKLEKMEHIISKKDTLSTTDPEYYLEVLTSLRKDIEVCDTLIHTNDIRIEKLIEDIDKYEQEKQRLSIQLQKELDVDKELTKMEDGLDTIRKQIIITEKIIGNNKLEISESDLSIFIVFLKNIDQVVQTTYAFGSKPIKKIVELLKEEKNVSSYIQANIDNGFDDSTETIIYNRILQMLPNINIFNEKDAVESCRNCQLKSFYISMYNMVHVDRDNSKKLSREDIKYMELAWANIQRILVSFSQYKDIIQKLPPNLKKDFTVDSILNRLNDMKSIFDEVAFNDLLALAKEISLLKKLKDEESSLHDNIKRLSSFSQLPEIKYQYELISDALQSVINQRADIKKDNSRLLESKSDLQRECEYYKDCYESFSLYQQTTDEYNELLKQYQIYIQSKEIYEETSRTISVCKMDYTYHENMLQKLNLSLNEYKRYKKELKRYRKVFEDITVIRKGLSSKEGVPLKYMLRYMGNTEEITNELLDIAYDGKIRIGKFDITKDSFTIPFYNRGKKISDVRYASQGEISFLTIALSFALSSQTLRKYNIMLLDEVDGPLDIDNSKNFIPVLENQMDRIKCEQCVTITHNEIFLSYPVDIIDLSFGEYLDKRYSNANMIDVILE